MMYNTDDMIDNKIMTKQQLAAYLQVNPKEIQRLRSKGLPTIVLGPKTIRFDVDAVNAWLNGAKTKGGQATATSDDFVLPKIKIGRPA